MRKIQPIVIVAVLLAAACAGCSAGSNTSGNGAAAGSGNASSSIKSESSSAAEKVMQPLKIVKCTYKTGHIAYPRVSGIPSRTIGRRINNELRQFAEKTYHQQAALLARYQKDRQEADNLPAYSLDLSYSVKYNDRGKLSILATAYEYEGGAHGTPLLTSFNYRINQSAKNVRLEDNFASEAHFQAADRYVAAYTRSHLQNYPFAQDNHDLTIAGHPFYWTIGGLYVVFGPYELGPYSDGTKTVFVPARFF
ncbi:MAG: DUF3298 and DUF4163 domain-containing protein [Sporolactobacillus sp.]|jgi:hypothetical protein|nr:DUF3298 and DUF4163 domain-containing protein [Sporolactobacillus sp.]